MPSIKAALKYSASFNPERFQSTPCLMTLGMDQKAHDSDPSLISPINHSLQQYTFAQEQTQNTSTLHKNAHLNPLPMGMDHPSDTPSKLLIVEDDPMAQRVYQAFLKNLQHPANFAATYQEAALKIEQTQYELIIMDIGLPDGNGLDLAEQCLSHPTPPIIVIVSVYGSEIIQERIHALRCQYLTKPITFEQFKGLLKHP